MRAILVLLLMITVSMNGLYAQSFLRAAYRVTGQLDSLNQATALVDTLWLIASAKEAFYFHPAAIKQDSVDFHFSNMTIGEYYARYGQGGAMEIKAHAFYRVNILNRERVHQRTDDMQIYADDHEKTTYINDKWQWHFLDETTTLAGFRCHKAQAEWMGRKWTVYYTRDIPLPFGPWKLQGLPGLVVWAESSGSAPYRFELIGVEKIVDEQFSPGLFYRPELAQQYVKVKHRQALKNLYVRYQEPLKVYKSKITAIGLNIEGAEEKIKQSRIEHFNPIEFLPERNGKKQ
ncbi:GLPGLI family protein [Thermonema lapsum]|uniref:GLPGLI family protein n=1 Tax=Thermonema lapsum TaxID=28195 RepID=A0A846MNT2_9BACT|nr:GLPGLI family protein [Thermonema lapsum]NIK73115.1 GLPGLI family protein [Thermonema lapsum]